MKHTTILRLISLLILFSFLFSTQTETALAKNESDKNSEPAVPAVAENQATSTETEVDVVEDKEKKEEKTKKDKEKDPREKIREALESYKNYGIEMKENMQHGGGGGRSKKENKKEKVAKALDDAQKNRFTHLVVKVAHRMEIATERLENISDNILSSITTLEKEHKNLDLSTERNSVDIAIGELSEASYLIRLVEKSISDKENKLIQTEILLDTKNALQETRAHLQKAQLELQDAIKAVKNKTRNL